MTSRNRRIFSSDKRKEIFINQSSFQMEEVKSELPINHSSIIDIIIFIPFFSFLHGINMKKVGNLLIILSKMCFLFAILASIYRICTVDQLFPKDSIIKVAAYTTEVIGILMYLLIQYKLKIVKEYFTSNISHDISMKKSLKILDYIYIIVACGKSIINFSYFLISDPMSKYQVQGIHLILTLFAYPFAQSAIISCCFIYAVATLSYYYGQASKLNQLKEIIKVKEMKKILKIINDFQQETILFQNTFSFMPFCLTIFVWFQGLVYMIGGAFDGRTGIWFDWFVQSESLYLQLCGFGAIIFAVYLNDNLSFQTNQLVLLLESESIGDDTLKLSTRLRFINKPLTAWNVFDLKLSLIYPYISSLVSFSLLFLQLELRINPQQKLLNCTNN